VIGDAGYLVDPDDAEAWAASMTALAEDGVERAALSLAGRERARMFDRAASADLLEHAYRSAGAP
jgi:glycosyltransferase involved in cell wall biosynthesis